jgi:phosphoadenosine phosphosulfate reductase
MIYDGFKKMKEQGEKYILLFSSGRDSCVMLDLASKFTPNLFTTVFFYFVKGLEFQESYLRKIENKYDIKILRLPHWEISNYEKMHGKEVRILKCKDMEASIRRQLDIPWLAYGYRKDESMTRRSMIGSLRNAENIDYKFKKMYPIADFTEKKIVEYIKQNKILLPREYYHGMRNIDQFKCDGAVWIKNEYPDDWKKIIGRFPLVEAEAFRWENKK